MEEIMNRIQVINKLIQTYGFTKYLEIGIRNPEECFNHIECNIKHSVDPGYENPNNPAQYPITSDDFFTKLNFSQLDLIPNYKWDIIFVDGLHLAPQVERDILNSLDHLSDKGIIVVHDCNPFMYSNDYTRVTEDFWGQKWNGTVWKAIYKLKTSRSDLKICTVNLDEGIGIITRGSQELIPLNNPYFEYRIFEQEIDLALNLIPFENLIKWINQ